MTPGHQLWILLQSPRYVREGDKPFDWWPLLPAQRREEYEAAAKKMTHEGQRQAK